MTLNYWTKIFPDPKHDVAWSFSREYAKTPYFLDYDKDVDVLSGENCLVIALSNIQMKSENIDIEFDNDELKTALQQHIESGISAKIGMYFDIDFSEFPCLVLFENIRSSRHIVVSLKDLSAEDIGERMRSIFSIIQKAVSNKKNPLEKVEVFEKKQKAREAKNYVTGKIKSITEKTFEIAVTAFVIGTASG